MSDNDDGRPAVVPGRMAILGVGQIGGSIALGARAAGLATDVVGYGRRPESMRRARELGLVDRAAASPAEAVAGAETVVLAAPLGGVAGLAAAAAGRLAAGALVIDVGSVKGPAVRDIEAALPADAAFVGCHPLAGTERFGPDAASADLFRGRRCILCPTARTAAVALGRARALWEQLGAEVVVMPADEHDALLAATSHLPHVAAYALAAALQDLPAALADRARALPTTSLRDTVRVAASSPVMWRDIFLENRAALGPLVERLRARVDELAAAMAAGDGERLEAFLAAARASRARLLPDE